MNRPILKIESGQAPKPKEETERQQRVENIVAGVGGSALQDPFGLRGYFERVQQGIESNRPFKPQTPLLPEGGALAAGLEAAKISSLDTGKAPFLSAGGTYTPTFAEYAASRGFGGGGGAVRPDYSAYRAALTDQAQQLNAQIQAMYNQLAEQAGANVGRIQDIYSGATAGIEAGYGSAAENVAQAYQSAQQQAADQMARLGIEEAAGQVLPSQALSQAEALAQLETGRAGGLSAAERYGASGGQFGSEMAQVAQQQGTEMNAAILASLQNRLAESLAAEQAGVSGGGGSGMSVSDMLRLQEAYNQDVLGELPLDERRLALDMAESQRRAASDAFAAAIDLVDRGLYDNLDDAMAAVTLGYSGYLQ